MNVILHMFVSLFILYKLRKKMGVCAVEICRLLKEHIDFLPVRDIRIRFTQRLPVRKKYWSLKWRKLKIAF